MSIYKIKPGDTLSDIIFQHIYNSEQRIYGKDNLLVKVIRFNPQISDPDLIYPEELIELSLIASSNDDSHLNKIKKSENIKITSKVTNITSEKFQRDEQEITAKEQEKPKFGFVSQSNKNHHSIDDKPLQKKTEQVQKSKIIVNNDNKKKDIIPTEKSASAAPIDNLINRQDDSEKIANTQLKVNQNNNWKIFGSLEVLSIYSFTQIDVIEKNDNSSARLISELNYGLDFKYRQHWSSDFSSFLQLGVKQVDYGPLTSKTLSNSSKTRAHFGVGGQYSLSEQTYVFASALYAQKSFIRSPNATQINIESVFLPELDLGLNFNLVNRNPFLLSTLITAGYLGSASTDNYQVSNGILYGVNLNLDYALKNFYLHAEVFVKQEEQDTSIVEQDKTEIGIDFGVKWDI